MCMQFLHFCPVYLCCRSDRPSSSLGQQSALKDCPMCMQFLHFCPVYVRCRSDRPSSSLGQQSALKDCPIRKQFLHCTQFLHFCRFGQSHINTVCIRCFLAGKSPNIQSYTVHKYVSGQPYSSALYVYIYINICCRSDRPSSSLRQ